MPPNIIVYIPEHDANDLIPDWMESREIQNVITLTKYFALYRHWRDDLENWGLKNPDGIPYIDADANDVKAAIDVLSPLYNRRGGT